VQRASEKCDKILVGKPEGTRQLRRPSHKMKDNIICLFTDASSVT
jgi:hypothetical protein